MGSNFWFELVKTSAAATTALSALAAVALFFYFRRRIPKIDLKLNCHHYVSERSVHLVALVTVTNLADVLVRSDRCSIAVRPLGAGAVGAAGSVQVRAVPAADGRAPVPLSSAVWNVPEQDEDCLWILDKGESNTFAFEVLLPSAGTSACLIEAEFHSGVMRSTLAPPPFGWRRDFIHDLAPAARAEVK